MRITAEAKEATRARILEVAKRLFREKGFEEATIRDIARQAGLATGTLFNYFPSKEEVAVALAEAAASAAHQEFLRKRRANSTLREDLFLQISSQIRGLKPLRKFIQPVVDTLRSPPLGTATEASQRLHREQLEAVAEILHAHQIDEDRWSMTMPIHWTLYAGVLSFWGRDKSPKQEDTLAMLDQAVNMFVTWLQTDE